MVFPSSWQHGMHAATATATATGTPGVAFAVRPGHLREWRQHD